MSSARKMKQQLKLKREASKPRNPLLAPARQRKAGSHRKPSSALRRAEKMELKKQLDKN